MCVMKPERKVPQTALRHHELTESDLNALTRGVGERARAQTIEQRERLSESLRKELASVREAVARNVRTSS